MGLLARFMRHKLNECRPRPIVSLGCALQKCAICVNPSTRLRAQKRNLGFWACHGVHPIRWVSGGWNTSILSVLAPASRLPNVCPWSCLCLLQSVRIPKNLSKKLQELWPRGWALLPIDFCRTILPSTHTKVLIPGITRWQTPVKPLPVS